MTALLGLFLAISLTACGMDLGPAATPTPSPTPTQTPLPLALSVNGDGITMEEFNAELARYQQVQAALGNSVDADTATQTVANDYIDTLLLAQGAATQGYSVDDVTLQSNIDALAMQIGGSEALSAWQTANGYTEAEFRSSLQRQLNAAWMRDQIAGAVPSTAEQVHIRQILLYNATDAQTALEYLQAGWDFTALAAQYDPATQGELGWLPRGYLTEKAIEDAAFALQAGAYSGIIESQAGYHILYLVESDPARQLSPDALLTLQEHAVADWLTQRRAESTILFAPSE